MRITIIKPPFLVDSQSPIIAPYTIMEYVAIHLENGVVQYITEGGDEVLAWHLDPKVHKYKILFSPYKIKTLTIKLSKGYIKRKSIVCHNGILQTNDTTLSIGEYRECFLS